MDGGGLDARGKRAAFWPAATPIFWTGRAGQARSLPCFQTPVGLLDRACLRLLSPHWRT